MPDPSDERFPRAWVNGLAYNKWWAVVLATILGFAVGLQDIEIWLAAVGCLGIGAVSATSDVREASANWIVLGDYTTVVCISGTTTMLRNAEVARVTWTDAPTTSAGPPGDSNSEIILETAADRYRVSLLFGLRSHRNRARRQAQHTFETAAWVRHKGPWRAGWAEWKAGWRGEEVRPFLGWRK